MTLIARLIMVAVVALALVGGVIAHVAIVAAPFVLVALAVKYLFF